MRSVFSDMLPSRSDREGEDEADDLRPRILIVVMGERSLNRVRNVGAHAPTMDEPISIMLQNCCVVRISVRDLVR